MDKGAVFYLIEVEEPLLKYSFLKCGMLSWKCCFYTLQVMKGEHHVRKSI